MRKFIGITLGALVALYGLLCAGLYAAMLQPPERFGAIMSHVTRLPAIVSLILPFEPFWMSARAGRLKVGDPAPDFELPAVDHSRLVRLSSEYQSKPVVLIFGSYT